MLDKLKELFSNFPFLLPGDFINIASAAKIKTYEKGEILFSEGEKHYYVYMVIRGLLRSYVVNEEGKDVTILLAPEKAQAGSLETFIHDKPSTESVEALEKTTAIRLDTRKVRILASDNPRMLKLRVKMLERALGEAVGRIKFHTVLSPEEKYKQFCSDFPSLERRVKQRHLSSYLGITPQSLSRIRGRMDLN